MQTIEPSKKENPLSDLPHPIGDELPFRINFLLDSKKASQLIKENLISSEVILAQIKKIPGYEQFRDTQLETSEFYDTTVWVVDLLRIILNSERAVTALKENLITWISIFESSISPRNLNLLFSPLGLFALRNDYVDKDSLSLHKNFFTEATMAAFLKNLITHHATDAKESNGISVNDHTQQILKYIFSPKDLITPKITLTNKLYAKKPTLLLLTLAQIIWKKKNLNPEDFDMDPAIFQELMSTNGLIALKEKYITPAQATAFTHVSVLHELLTTGLEELTLHTINLKEAAVFKDHKNLHEMLTLSGQLARFDHLLSLKRANKLTNPQILSLLVSPKGRFALKYKLLSPERIRRFNLDVDQLEALLSPYGLVGLILCLVTPSNPIKYLLAEIENVPQHKITYEIAEQYEEIFEQIPLQQNDIFDLVTKQVSQMTLMIPKLASLFVTENNSKNFTLKVNEELEKIVTLNSFQSQCFNRYIPADSDFIFTKKKLDVLEDTFSYLIKREPFAPSYNELNNIQTAKDIYLTLLVNSAKDSDTSFILLLQLEKFALNSQLLSFAQAPSATFFKINPFEQLDKAKIVIAEIKASYMIEIDLSPASSANSF